MNEDERAELIAALHQSTVFNERMLELNAAPRCVVARCESARDREIEYMRAALGRWQEQMAKLRQRMASLTIQPPDRTQ